MLKVVEKISDVLAAAASFVSRIMVIFVATILFVQVVLRYLFLYSLPWPEEASRYVMIWAVMLGGSLLVKDEQLVSVDFFDKLWSPKLLVYRNIAFRVLLILMLAVLFYYGLDQAMFARNRTTAALQISWFWPYLAIPVGAGLMLIQMVALFLRDVIRGVPKDQGPTILRAEI
ncbi:MAG: TRAP transporter small permease [Tepidamorphaceae bacterium]|nr:TRAP transporter small permease [Rhodobiaceae bacterium]MCC0048008.1 TRAP transporter small permease [Rhodobiaceae bacterium]